MALDHAEIAGELDIDRRRERCQHVDRVESPYRPLEIDTGLRTKFPALDRLR